MENSTLETLNTLYESHKEKITGMYHNLLWQVMINQSCEGAFTRLWNGEIGIAQEDGGYIPTGCHLDEKNEQIIDDLNLKVFGLAPNGAWNVIAKSLRKKGTK